MIKIYLTNLGQYNAGKLVGTWLELPATEEEIETAKEKIGINEEYEEWAVTDYESPYSELEINEYTDIDELNELAEDLENFDEAEELAFRAYLENGNDITEAIEYTQEGNYTIYYDCDDMSDVAREVVENCGYLNQMPEHLQNYFDYEAFGRDLDIEGTFIEVGNHYVELY